MFSLQPPRHISTLPARTQAHRALTIFIGVLPGLFIRRAADAACLLPQPQRDRHRINAEFRPPGCFVTTAINLAMVDTAQGDGELVTYFSADRPRLRVADMVRFTGLAPTDRARLNRRAMQGRSGPTRLESTRTGRESRHQKSSRSGNWKRANTSLGEQQLRWLSGASKPPASNSSTRTAEGQACGSRKRRRRRHNRSRMRSARSRTISSHRKRRKNSCPTKGVTACH